MAQTEPALRVAEDRNHKAHNDAVETRQVKRAKAREESKT